MSLPIRKALVAPLNWGLGHATRCIPIINSLLDQNIEVFLASDGQAYHLLKEEFPQLMIFELPNLKIHYDAHFIRSMAVQTPKFIKSIVKDCKAVQSLMARQKFDYIISDNRYGVYHRDAYNILLTHQLQVSKPNIFQRPSRRIIKNFTKKFNHCWIPDLDDKDNLTGKMSAPTLNIPKTYIGILSRFNQSIQPNNVYETAIILSGPEPARTHFENKILKLFKDDRLNSKVALVRGILSKHPLIESPHPYLDIFNFLNANELNQLIVSTPKIVCRSGYSSIMDLIRLNKKALLVPTPGQLEQEYLADRLGKKGIFLHSSQSNFNLKLLDQLDAMSLDAYDKFNRAPQRIPLMNKL